MGHPVAHHQTMSAIRPQPAGHATSPEDVRDLLLATLAAEQIVVISTGALSGPPPTEVNPSDHPVAHLRQALHALTPSYSVSEALAWVRAPRGGNTPLDALVHGDGALVVAWAKADAASHQRSASGRSAARRRARAARA